MIQVGGSSGPVFAFPKSNLVETCLVNLAFIWYQRHGSSPIFMLHESLTINQKKRGNKFMEGKIGLIRFVKD